MTGPVMLVQQGESIAITLLCIYLFLTYSRLTEVMGNIFGSSFHIAAILLVSCTVLVVLGPALRNTLASPVTVLFLCLTACFVASIPFSVWKGGSFHLIFFEWSVAALTFFVAAGLVTSVETCRRVAYSFAAGVIAILLIFRFFGMTYGGRTGLETRGTLGNANLLALQLLMGMPFLLLPILRYGEMSLRGGAALIALLASLYVVGSTGSRSGLIAVATLAVIVFLHSSPIGKMKLVILFAVVGFSAIVVLPRSVTERYMTLFPDDNAMDPVAVSARESTAARRHHLQQSIELTLQHPIFGVGPGQFMVAAAAASKSKDERAAWLETHNTYTEVSSEAGIPAAIAYVLMIAISFRRLLKIYRNTRQQPDMRDISDVSFCLLLSLTATTITAFFASVAYQLYFPMLLGFSVGLGRVATQAPATDRATVTATDRTLSFRPQISVGQPNISQPARRGSFFKRSL